MGKDLAKRQGVHREVQAEGSRRQNTGPTLYAIATGQAEQESHKRHTVWVRRPTSSKPKTYTERQYVYAAGIRVKDVRLTLGDLQLIKMEKSAEAIVPSQTTAKDRPCCLHRRMRG